MHNETNINYESASPRINRVLLDSSRQDLADFVKSDNFIGLFGHRVDNAPGYEDGASFAIWDKVSDAYEKLTESEKKDLLTLTELLINYTSSKNGEISPQDRRDILLTANQLVQHPKMADSGNYQRRILTQDLTKKISSEYVTSNSEKVTQWDAQIAENRGYWHASEMNVNGMITLLSTGIGILGLGIAGISGAVESKTVAATLEHFLLPTFLTGASLSALDQFIMLPIQNIGKSPVYNEGLIKGKYSLARHPLYGLRMSSAILAGISSLNPVGAFFAAKTIYHGTRSCEEQDKRLKILHGEEAASFQEDHPMIVPGTKILMNGISKFASKKVVDALQKPVSHYLAKIPYLASEPKEEELLSGSRPNVHFKSNLDTY